MKLALTLLLITALPLYARPAHEQRLPIVRNGAPAVQVFPPTTDQIATSFQLNPFTVAGWRLSLNPVQSSAVCGDDPAALWGFAAPAPLETCNQIHYNWLFDLTATNGMATQHYTVRLFVLLDRPSNKKLSYRVQVDVGAPQSQLPF